MLTVCQGSSSSTRLFRTIQRRSFLVSLCLVRSIRVLKSLLLFLWAWLRVPREPARSDILLVTLPFPFYFVHRPSMLSLHKYIPANALSHSRTVTGPVARFARQIASQGYIVAAPSSYHEFTGPEPLAYDGPGTDKGNEWKITKTVEAYDEDATLSIDTLLALPTCNGRVGATGKSSSFPLFSSIEERR